MRSVDIGTYTNYVPLEDEEGNVITDEEYLHLLDYVSESDACTPEEVVQISRDELRQFRSQSAC
jgi:hypothetical protein